LIETYSSMPSYELRDLLQGFRRPAQPSIKAYSGKAICIVGGTSGVGRAAAIQFLQFGADEVIITCRTAASGMSAKQFIESALEVGAGSSDSRLVGKLTVMELDLLSWESVKLFTEKLKKVRVGVGGLDYLILNAAVIQTRFRVSSTGWYVLWLGG
jgi:NAD(P)-dependent dehydrogenase (short-subunit alcohol dehydrogenase family)